MLSLLALLTLSPSAHAAPRPFLSAGVGFPELIHAEGGLWVSPRLDLGFRASSTLLAPLIGVGVDGVLLGDDADGTPRHGMLLSGRAQINPLPPIRLVSGGDRLGSALTLELGYQFLGEHGLLFRAGAGALLAVEEGLSGGPVASMSVGWSR